MIPNLFLTHCYFITMWTVNTYSGVARLDPRRVPVKRLREHRLPPKLFYMKPIEANASGGMVRRLYGVLQQETQGCNLWNMWKQLSCLQGCTSWKHQKKVPTSSDNSDMGRNYTDYIPLLTLPFPSLALSIAKSCCMEVEPFASPHLPLQPTRCSSKAKKQNDLSVGNRGVLATYMGDVELGRSQVIQGKGLSG